MSLLESGENYLETILMLLKTQSDVHAIDIATHLGFSKPSVSIALKKLSSDEYITIDNSSHIHLTEKGEKIATKIYERHVLNSLSVGLKSVNPYAGLIHLIPCIEYENGAYNLSLKIGYDKDYVIKDILEFIQMTENNIEYSYGQKLSFTHSYECFDNISKEFYSFIRNIVREDTSKSVTIRKSHLLKILELYQGSYIAFKGKNE